jgi:hypothetical protein
MPVLTRSQTKKQQELFGKQQAIYDAANQAVQLIISSSENHRQEEEYISRLNWFKTYCKNSIQLCESSPPGIERIRICNELFYIVDQYFHEILKKERHSDSYLRLACSLYNKATDFYYTSYANSNHTYTYTDANERKRYDYFIAAMGIVREKLIQTFLHLDLKPIFNQNYHINKLVRLEEKHLERAYIFANTLSYHFNN